MRVPTQRALRILLVTLVVSAFFDAQASGYVSGYKSMTVPGQFNAWNVAGTASPANTMRLVADYLWQLDYFFGVDVVASPKQYKIAANSTWSGANWGAGGRRDDFRFNNASTAGVVTRPGIYRFQLDERGDNGRGLGSLTLVAAMGIPVITWSNPAPITYGTALSATQLNATSSVAGSFSYSPTIGALLNVGTNKLTAVFTAADTVNYVSPLTNTVSLVVSYDEVSLAGGETTFEVVQKDLSWQQAKADAVALGGRLAVFPTAEMYDRVMAKVRQTYSGWLWMGLTDEVQEGDWRWVDGSGLMYSRWSGVEPNGGAAENYAWTIESNLWVDTNVGNYGSLMPYILERRSMALAALPCSQSGTAWTIDTREAHDGVSSAKAQAVDGTESYREYVVTGPAVVDFWWKVSSEQDFDFFSYAVDGVKQEELSGEVDWTFRTLTFPEGSHTIRWSYSKDSSAAVGQDAGWLDNVAVHPATPSLRVRDGAAVLDGPVTVNFGAADLGAPGSTRSLSFSNEGYIPLELQLSLPEESAFRFENLDTTYDLYLDRGVSVEVPIYLSTAAIGGKSAQLTIAAPTSATAPPQVTLAGGVFGTPVIDRWPIASPVYLGQKLGNSALTGGTANVPGSFAWTTPDAIPLVGTNSYTVSFTPADANGYKSLSADVPVAVTLDPAADEDGDGLTNGEEATLGTSPYLRDTDSDGATDYREVGDGTDPLNANSFNALSKGLVAYYPFDGNANDESGNQRPGSVVGATFGGDLFGRAGRAARFAGDGQQIIFPYSPECLDHGSGDFSYSFWIRHDGPRGFERIGGGNSLDGRRFWFETVDGYLAVYSFDTDLQQVNWGLDRRVGVGKWNSVVISRRAGVLRVYVDGVKAGETPYNHTIRSSQDDFTLGINLGLSEYFFGAIDNFRIYNRSLSDSDIQSLYFQESGGVTGVVGQALSESVGATAATGLPPGLTLNAATGIVSGVPTSPGLYEVKLTGQDGIERTRQFNILRASQSAATVDIGLVAGRLYADYFGTTLSGGSFGLGILPGGSAYNFTGKTRDQILSDFVWVNGSRINGQLVGPADGGQFYVPSLSSSLDPNLPMYAFLSTGATTLDGNWLVLGGPDISWLTPDADNPLASTVMELSLAGNRIYAGTDGWRYRNGVLVSTGDEDLGFIAPPVVTGGMAEATQAQPFSYQIVATGNPTTYAAAGLPAGLSINPATGAISGSSTQRGVFNVTLSASNAGWTRSANLQLTVKLGLPVVTNPGTQSVKVGSAFNYQVQANNEATAYAAQGLPVGLSINATTGLISGRAAQPGTYPVVVSATNTSGTGQASFELNASYDEVSLAGGETSFEVIEKNLTWHQAKADAEALGGRLGVFPTGEMYDRVIAEVRKSYAGTLLIGLTDEAQEGDWRWIDGTSLTYGRWYWGEPNNSGDEDFAMVYHSYHSNTWNDTTAAVSMPYLLERGTTALASLPWSSSGMAWTLDTTVAHDGISSAKVQTTDGQSSYREYTVTGPKVVDFWWKVSSEQDFDFFAYSIDGVKEGEISGNADWEYRTVTLGAGEHTMRWTYTKDELGSVGSDAGWVDGFATYPAVANLEVRSATNVLTGAATIDFGSGGGTNVAKNLTFLNKGYVPMDVQISLAQDAPFSFRDGGGKTYELHLERGEEVDLELVMDTSTIGTKTAVMTIEAPDSQTPAPTLTLTGIALGGEIALYQGASAISHNQPTPVDLGFAPSETVFTVANEGNASNLLISDISVSSGFLISQMPSASVPPGGTTSFKVVSLDSQPGLRQGAVTIACNDLDNQVFVFPVQAKVMFGTGNQSGGGTSTSGAGGASGWDFATATLPSGQAGQALKTGATPHGGSSSLQGVFSGPGMLTWKWQVATQQGFDWLVCEVNGAEVAGISTKNAAWQSQAIRVPAGATVRWIYRKDASGSVGEDSGYVADLNFQKFNAGSEGYDQWAARTGNSSPTTPNAKTGLPAIFGWLGAWDPSVGPGTNHYRAVREAGVFKYRFPVSKTATGNARVEFSTDLRFPPQTNSWSTRGLQQSVQSEDSEKAVIEVTAPSQSKGFFRLLYAP